MEEISSGIKIAKTLKKILDKIKKKMVEHFNDRNITGPQIMVMGILSNKDNMKISELSSTIGLSNSTVSGIIDRLEKQGLVERARSVKDRRVVYVSLTPLAKNMAHKRFEKLEKNLEDILKSASTDEVEIIIKGFETLDRVIDREDK